MSPSFGRSCKDRHCTKKVHHIINLRAQSKGEIPMQTNLDNLFRSITMLALLVW